MTYFINISGNQIATVSGADFAFEVFKKACDLADMLGETAYLISGETGEVLADSDAEDDCEYDEPDYDECGFDPYGGCYTYDC